MDPTGGYDSFVAEYYDHIPPYRERPDLDFYIEMGREIGDPILELGCGTGRILIPLARAGLEVVGLDLSQSMLGVCVERLAREGEAVHSRTHLIRADMRSFDLGRSFRLVTVPFRAFQHLLEIEDQLACLNRIHHHLLDGGALILDLFNPSLQRLTDDRYLSEYEVEPEFRMPGGRRIVRRHRNLKRDLRRQILEVEIVHDVVHPEGGREQLVQHFPLRYLFRFEVEHLLARAGFAVEAVYADFQRRPFGSSWPGEMIFVARKA